MPPRLALWMAWAALLIAGWQGAGPVRAQSDDVAQMTPQQLVEQRCSACHGADGNSTDAQFPKLAGQTVAYLAVQLDAYRSGARHSDVMSPQATGLSDAQIIGVSRFYAMQPAKGDAVTDQALAANGERVFFSSRRGIPPCAACHNGGGHGPMAMMQGQGMMGMMGMGMMGNMGPVPKLNGQHAAYIVSQLDAFIAGTRPSSVMHTIATTLSETDRKAVARYLSGLH